MTLVGFEVDDFELLQTIFPLGQHGVIGKQIDAFNFHCRPVGDKFFPVLFGRIADRRGHDAEVLRAFVGANVEKIVAMIDVVFVVRWRGRMIFQFGVRIVRRKVANFSRGLAVRVRERSPPCRASDRRRYQTARPSLHRSDRSCRCPARDGKICRCAS